MSPFQSCLDYLEQLDGGVAEDALHGPLQLIEPHAVDELGFGLDFSADDLCTWQSFFPQVTDVRSRLRVFVRCRGFLLSMQLTDAQLVLIYCCPKYPVSSK